MPCLGLPHLQFLVSARPATNEHRNSRDAGLIFLEVVGAAEGVVADPVAVAEGWGRLRDDERERRDPFRLRSLLCRRKKKESHNRLAGTTGPQKETNRVFASEKSGVGVRSGRFVCKLVMCLRRATKEKTYVVRGRGRRWGGEF